MSMFSSFERSLIYPLPEAAMETCSTCRLGQLNNDQETYSHNIGNITLRVTIPCQRCTRCNESLCRLDDMQIGEIAIALHCLSHSMHNATVHVFCRKALGLTRDELAQHYGTTGAVVRDMERSGSISEASWNALTSLLRAAATTATFTPTVILL